MRTLAQAIEIGTTLLTAAGLAYGLLVLAAAWSFRLYLRHSRRLPQFAPPVSILKPVKGFEPGTLEAWRSHCRQDYAGEWEVIFGAGSADEEAADGVRRLIAEFPGLPIRLVLCKRRLGTNGKVSNLLQMLPEARHGFLLIDDSDIVVSPSYLDRVMRQFAAPGKRTVGMVTALYRGRAMPGPANGPANRPENRPENGPANGPASGVVGKRTLGSILEALGIATDFQAGVLVARLVEGGIHFGLGSTLAVRREALAASGGLSALVDELADDYRMGERIARAGYAIRLAAEVVETAVPAYTLPEFLKHQLRWARTVRDSRRWGYAGMIFTHMLPLAAANVLASGASFASLWLLGLAFFLRLGTAMQVGAGVLGDRQVLAYLWLLPLRDAAGFAIWIWSFAGNTIEWRGERFLLERGRLVKMG